VQSLPLAGRTRDFLGGVGPFEVEARAVPTSVRVGETIEFTINVQGPGSLGLIEPPHLTRLERLPIGLRIDSRPDRMSAEPPAHMFVYHLRPTRAGEAVLPPVVIAGFDPETEHYVTRATEGIPIRVTDVPMLDPAAVAYGRPAAPESRWVWLSGQRGRGLALAIVVIFVSIATALYARRPAVRRADRVRDLTRGMIARIFHAPTDGDKGRVISEGLGEYLRLAIGRPAGALTPEEAEHGVAQATGSDDLARRARWLIAYADQAQFGAGASHAASPVPPNPPEATLSEHLQGAGFAFFKDLGRSPIVARATDPNAGETPAG
jgi:hypothetical protein